MDCIIISYLIKTKIAFSNSTEIWQNPLHERRRCRVFPSVCELNVNMREVESFAISRKGLLMKWAESGGKEKSATRHNTHFGGDHLNRYTNQNILLILPLMIVKKKKIKRTYSLKFKYVTHNHFFPKWRMHIVCRQS